MQPVSLITIHHEGAGVPVDWARGGEGGYTYWIGDVNGDGVHLELRTPWVSWATLDFNHVSLDICLSGDRDTSPVTDADIFTIGVVVAEARNKGYVVDHPLVRQHHDSPGSNTVCPGTFTRDPHTWLRIVAACQASGQISIPPPPSVKPPTVKVQATMQPLVMKPWNAIWRDANGHVIAAVSTDGDVYAFGCPYRPWADQHVDLANQGPVVAIGQAPGLPGGRYQLTTANGNHYAP